MRGNVHTIRPEVQSIRVPTPLATLPLFLVWRYEARYDGDPKPLKVPYYPLGNKRVGKQGSPEDRAKLTTFHVAREQAAKRGMDGVGLALLEGEDIVALDFDNCVDEAGKIPAEIERVISNTYAEYSPSGKGVRALLRGNVGNRKSESTAERYGMETFSTTGYVTLTGNMLPYVDLLGYEDTLARVTPELEEFCKARFGSSTPLQPDAVDFMAGYEPKLGLTVEESYDLLQQLDPDMGREDWIRVGMALHHEYSGEEEGFELWNDWSAYGSKYPSEEGLRTQWDSFTRRIGPGRKQITMASVKHMVKQSQPVSEAALREVAERSRVAADFDGKFRPVRAGQLASEMPETSWLIKGVLPRSLDPVILFGASGAGKSFVALDMACAIARGVDWRGMRVITGRVLYIAAEGGTGIGKRMRAYADHYQIDVNSLNVDVITASPNLLEQDDISELVKTISAFGPYDAVFVDTLAQTTPGANENTGEDMGRVLANIKAIQAATGATVIAVHHAGKDLARGSRGWSGIKAAAEAQLEVVRDEDTGLRYMRVEKMKDGEDGAKFGFKLEVLQVGVDSDGDAVTSCAVVPTDAVPQAKETSSKGLRRRGRIENHVLEVLALLEPEIQTIKVDELVKRCADMLPPPEEGKRDTRRQHVNRAIQMLGKEKDGPISVAGGLVVLYQ